MVKEVKRYINSRIILELWARSAGRCQFKGCNRILYKSPITQESVNISEKAHIYSFSKDGPRGWGHYVNNLLGLNSIENLMLVCHDCHKTIDQDKNGQKYSADLLSRWKKDHENRIFIVSGIEADKKSHVVFYGSNIGEQKSLLQKNEAISAMFPDSYPFSENPISLSMQCSHEDKSEEFWTTESRHLKTIFSQKIEPLIESSPTKHFSLFSFATIPLLIQLGALFTDKIPVDTYQPIREPKGWKWQSFPDGFEFIINKSINDSYQPALIISLSETVKVDRISKVLGDKVSIWELTVPKNHIGNDNIRSKFQLSMMRNVVRSLMREIKQVHGQSTPLSIFPAMTISCAVEMGRARMPKADMPWIIYDQNHKVDTFIKALTIGEI